MEATRAAKRHVCEARALSRIHGPSQCCVCIYIYDYINSIDVYICIYIYTRKHTSGFSFRGAQVALIEMKARSSSS